MKKALFALCLALFATSAFAQNCATPEASPQEQKNYLKKLVDSNQLDLYASAAASCRPEGYFCKNSLECCGFCHDGVCGSGGGGGCRPDGAACRNSLECCGFCHDGICGNDSGGGGCRPEGLACRNSLECCNFCHDGICN